MDETVDDDGENSVKLSKFTSIRTDYSFAAERLKERKTFQDDMMVEIDLSYEEEGDEVGRVIDAISLDKKKSGTGISQVSATRRKKGTSSKKRACKWMGLAVVVVLFAVFGYCLSIVLHSDDCTFTSDNDGNATSPARGSILTATSSNGLAFDGDTVGKNNSTLQNLNQSEQVICLEDNDNNVLCGIIIDRR